MARARAFLSSMDDASGAVSFNPCNENGIRKINHKKIAEITLGSKNQPASLQFQNCCELVVVEEVQVQNQRQQHYYLQELMAPVLLHQMVWHLQLQELPLVCKSTEAVDTAQEISG